jgi:hypothetical protein
VGSSKPKPNESLAVLFPDLAAQAVGWDPKTVSRGSKTKLLWRCELGHEWKATVSNRANLASGCPYCSGNEILVGFNDLATTHPDIASQAAGWDPKTVSRGSGKKLLWRCELGHEWQALVSDRTGQIAKGCGVCAGKKVMIGVTDLATTHPGIAAQAVGWDPKTVSAGSSRRRLWRCELGHEWDAQIKGRVRGYGCLVCDGKQVLVGFNDLATTHPDIASQAAGWDPKTVSRGSGKKLLWRCELGHEWNATVGNRARGEGCPICSGRSVLVGFNDLATTHPDVASQAVGWDPKTVNAGSNKMRRWRCNFGHEWNAIVASRALSERGCSSCAQTGFSPNLDGWLYFIDHDEWQMFQIGITNYPDERLNDHKKLGWIVREIRGAMDGSLTRDLETAILRSLKRRGAVFANKADGRKFDGWTEAWLKSSVNVSGLKDLLNFVHEDDALVKN